MADRPHRVEVDRLMAEGVPAVKAYLDGRAEPVTMKDGPPRDDRTVDQRALDPSAECTGEETYEAIQWAANTSVPLEACGFVLVNGVVVHCTNVDDAPYYRFKISIAEAEYWARTGHVVAVWHSHPTGAALPSPMDEELAVPGIPMLIYAVEDEDLSEFVQIDGKLVLSRMMSPE